MWGRGWRLPSRVSEGVFLTGSTMGHVIRMTATGALGITFVFLVDAANLFWISQLGDPTLVAAIGYAYAIQFFSVSGGVGLMIAATAVVSRRIGEGRREAARCLAGSGLITAMIVQSIVAGLIIAFREPLVAYAGAEGETARLAGRYLAITMPSLVPMAAGLIGSGVLRADGHGVKAMNITLFSGLFLMIVDPILIFGLGLGLDGAAIGILLFRVVLMGLAFYFAIYQENLIGWLGVSAYLASQKPYFAVAVPAIATQMATPAGNYLLTIVMARFGDDAVAAWAVVGRLTVLVFGGVFALSGAIGGIFGQNFGAGQYERLRSTYRDAMIFVLIYTALMWGVLIFATPYVTLAFGLEGQGAEVLRAFTYLGVGGFLFIGMLFVSNAAFNNLGKPGRSTLMNWFNHGVLSWPMAYLLAFSFAAPGVIYGQALAGIFAGGLAGLWGWRYVARLGPHAQIEVPPPRPWPSIDRYRRR